jgi:hypothetical protein
MWTVFGLRPSDGSWDQWAENIRERVAHANVFALPSLRAQTAIGLGDYSQEIRKAVPGRGLRRQVLCVSVSGAWRACMTNQPAL